MALCLLETPSATAATPSKAQSSRPVSNDNDDQPRQPAASRTKVDEVTIDDDDDDESMFDDEEFETVSDRRVFDSGVELCVL